MKKIEFKLKVIHIVVFFLILFSMVLLFEIVNLRLKLGGKLDNNDIESIVENTVTELVAEKNENKEKNNSKITKAIIKREEMAKNGNIDINSEFVKELYSRLFVSNFIANDYEGSFYKNDKTTLETLSNTEKSLAVLTYLEKQGKERVEQDAIELSVLRQMKHFSEEHDFVDDIRVYSKEEIEDAVNKIFGENVKINFENFDGCGECFEYIDGRYYAYVFPGGGFGALTEGLGQIQYVIEDGDYVYIYDKFVFKRYFAVETNYKGYTSDDLTAYYASSEDEKYVAIHKIDIDIDAYEFELEDDIIYDLYDSLNLYKHTFKKDKNGNYHWVSTEIVEEQN